MTKELGDKTQALYTRVRNTDYLASTKRKAPPPLEYV